MMNIVVSNLNRKHKLSEIYVKKIAGDILRIIKKSPKTKLEIVFLSDRSIRPLNRRYKGRDGATDVLSFDLGSCGQILISSDMALRNSRLFDTAFEKELVLYVIHGILHLFGYDDGKPKDRSRMFRAQDSILEKLCVKTRLSKVLTRR